MKIQGNFCLNRLEWQSLGLIFSCIFILKESLQGPFTLTSLSEECQVSLAMMHYHVQKLL